MRMDCAMKCYYCSSRLEDIIISKTRKDSTIPVVLYSPCKTCNSAETWICPFCEDKFGSRSSLIRHLNVTERREQAISKLFCSHCGNQCYDYEQLIQHVSNHKGKGLSAQKRSKVGRAITLFDNQKGTTWMNETSMDIGAILTSSSSFSPPPTVLPENQPDERLLKAICSERDMISRSPLYSDDENLLKPQKIFDTDEELRFILKSYLLTGISQTAAEKILTETRFYAKDSHYCALPASVKGSIAKVREYDYEKPRTDTTFNSPLYSIASCVARCFSNAEHCQRMEFDCPEWKPFGPQASVGGIGHEYRENAKTFFKNQMTKELRKIKDKMGEDLPDLNTHFDNDENENWDWGDCTGPWSCSLISEFKNTQGFARLASFCDDDELPVVIALFFDDFLKYRFSKISTGGLYMTLLNYDRKYISSPNAIHLLSLVHRNEDIMSIYEKVVEELEHLYVGSFRVYHYSLEKWVKVRVMLGLLLSDMPQRHKNSGMMSHTGDNSKCNTCHSKKEDIILVNSTHPKLRTSPLSKLYFIINNIKNETGERSNKRARYQYQKEFPSIDISNLHYLCELIGQDGHNVGFNFKKLNANPFWRLYDLYGFDVHQHQLPEAFHSELIGLFKLHSELLDKYILKTRLRPTFEKHLGNVSKQHLGINLSNTQVSSSGSNGEAWIRFLAAAPFALGRLVAEQNHLPIVEFKQVLKAVECFISHCEYLSILLQPSLSLNEINNAEELYKQTKRDMILTYPFEELKLKNNFHVVSHVFRDAKIWGPPILWWVRPYEHRHKTLWKLFQHSNMRELDVSESRGRREDAEINHEDEETETVHNADEKWVAERDKIIHFIKHMHPEEYEKYCPRKSSPLLKQSDIVIVSMGTMKRYAKIVNIPDSNTVEVRLLDIMVEKKFFRCIEVPQDIDQEDITLPKSNVLQKMIVVDGMINRFATLSLTKV